MAKTPKPVDIHVGNRLRLRRTLLGMSQEKLGTALGLTFQQIQKYEKGANRIGSSRLYEIGRILGVPVAYFFEGYEDENDPPAELEGVGRFDQSKLMDRETIELVRAYYSIDQGEVRHQVFELMKTLGGTRAKRTRRTTQTEEETPTAANSLPSFPRNSSTTSTPPSAASPRLIPPSLTHRRWNITTCLRQRMSSWRRRGWWGSRAVLLSFF